MVDLTAVERFEWDAGNARKSEDKHGVSQREAEQIFADAGLLVTDDRRRNGHEQRFHTLGRADNGRLLFVSFTSRAEGRALRVISAPAMNRKERTIFEAET